jgi:hypothetical protein
MAAGHELAVEHEQGGSVPALGRAGFRVKALARAMRKCLRKRLSSDAVTAFERADVYLIYDK